VSETYSDVDASADPAGAVEWQERMTTWPAVRAYKGRTYELLAAAERITDIGCGPGVDVAALGVHRCVGVDRSATMVAAAARRGARVARAEAGRLPFADGAFEGARADRVFQHLEDPDGALRELTRVLAPGGRVVITDPDQSTLVIRVRGVRQGTVDRLTALRRDIGYRNGTLIAEIPTRLDALGFVDVTVESFALVLTDPADAFGLPMWPEVWRERGGFTAAELDEWHAALRVRPRLGFEYQVQFFVVAGTKS
jgi:SAM-dependent methyltransferase